MSSVIEGSSDGTSPVLAPPPSVLVGRRSRPKPQVSIAVSMRPQSPEEERRAAAVLRLLLAQIARQHLGDRQENRS